MNKRCIITKWAIKAILIWFCIVIHLDQIPHTGSFARKTVCLARSFLLIDWL